MHSFLSVETIHELSLHKLFHKLFNLFKILFIFLIKSNIIFSLKIDIKFILNNIKIAFLKEKDIIPKIINNKINILMFEDIIKLVLAHHEDFTYEEVEEVCQNFYDKIPKKIKEETKLKRLNKYMTVEFELDSKEFTFE
jgi:hypothetical protein